MLTELYFRGLFLEYKRIFKCLNQLIQITVEQEGVSDEAFENALLVITDYIKMYGERVFGVLARDHKEDIINDYEVALKESDRYEFLKASTRQEIYKYLVKSYFE
jgi:hypothetical protein